MANPEHRKILKQGVETWNAWRSDVLKGSPDLSWADLARADLRGADLTRADLRWANLREADLIHADLSEANLSGADLRGADLRQANLSGAKLREADLIHAEKSHVPLTASLAPKYSPCQSVRPAFAADVNTTGLPATPCTEAPPLIVIRLLL